MQIISLMFNKNDEISFTKDLHIVTIYLVQRKESVSAE